MYYIFFDKFLVNYISKLSIMSKQHTDSISYD